MIKGKIASGKYKGRNFIAKDEDSIIILVSKGVFFNGSEMYSKFSRLHDKFINDNDELKICQ